MRKKKKKARKVYLSCRNIQKADYQKALKTRYWIIFADDPQDADFFIAPFDKNGLTDKQMKEIVQSQNLGLNLKYCCVKEDDLFNENNPDPLEWNIEEREAAFLESLANHSSIEIDDNFELGF